MTKNTITPDLTDIAKKTAAVKAAGRSLASIRPEITPLGIWKIKPAAFLQKTKALSTKFDNAERDLQYSSCLDAAHNLFEDLNYLLEDLIEHGRNDTAIYLASAANEAFHNQPSLFTDSNNQTLIDIAYIFSRNAEIYYPGSSTKHYLMFKLVSNRSSPYQVEKAHREIDPFSQAVEAAVITEQRLLAEIIARLAAIRDIFGQMALEDILREINSRFDPKHQPSAPPLSEMEAPLLAETTYRLPARTTPTRRKCCYIL